MKYKAQEEQANRAAIQRNADLQLIINWAQEPINVNRLCALIERSRYYVVRILSENSDKFTNLGLVKESNQILYQSKAKVKPVVIAASTIYKLHDDARYHDNMKLLRDNRKSAITYISGSRLSCNY